MMRLGTIEESFRTSDDGKCSIADNGMVSTAFPDATQAGVEMLERGGNAVDAACAAAFALGVCEPQASGIGGQSMAILHIGGKTISIDGSTRVPSLAHISRLRDGDRTLGYRAATVPSTVAVLGYLNFRYGRLKWSQVVEPAIRIAQEGYRITALQRRLQERELNRFLKVPSKSGAKYFLKDGKEPYDEGDLFIQPDLANTLSHIADNGARSFYQGLIAQRISEDMEANDGFLRAEDLALIPWPVERTPLRRSYRGVTMVTVPPPAAGRTLLLVLMMLNNLPSRILNQESPESFHFLAETFRKAFLLRRQRPFDPNTYPQVADQNLTKRQFAREQAESIRDRIDPGLPLIDPPTDDQDTTHLSVMDSEGNAVGITQSIELAYGSKAAAEGLGFLYNNYMRALETQDASHPYYLRPNAAPWTSVAPVIAFHKKQPWLVTGSPGSERIYSTVSQFLSHMIDKNLPMSTAIDKPRFHCSIGGKLSVEDTRMNPEVLTYLEEMGYKIDRMGDYGFYFGAVHTAMKCQTTGGFQGVAEVRRDGTAAGL